MANTNKPPDGVPGAAEFGLWRAYLALNGYTPQQANEAIGNTPNGRSRKQIESDQIEWIRENA